MSDYGSDYDCAYDSEELDDEGHDLIDDDGDAAGEVKLDSPNEEDYPFTVLSTEQIMSFMLDTIKEVNTVVQLPPTITRILLNHFKWDKEKLYERYYEGDNQEQLFRDAHIVNPNKSKKSKKRRATRSAGNTVDCLICYVDYPAKNMVSIACGHQFCKECWIQYLTTKIMEEGQGATISCASHDCDILVDDETVFDLITDSKVILRYKQLITNSFIECNRLFRWCPKPECSHVIRVEYLDFKPVKCVCNMVFCFVCGHNWHYPLKCDILKKWQKKCSDDSETFNWIAANTKDCPQCKMPIEKNGGCNHMWCRNPSCKFEFCWLCMGEWGRHGYNPCNRFNEDAVSAAKDASDRARAVLQRYLFYCNRYMNHMQSLKFENKLYEMAKTKMEEMQRHNMTWVEVQFLNTAVDILTSCRQSLMYTYAFAYYLVKNNQVHIFEDNQKDLEAATEKLSEYLERDLTTDNLTAIKQNVQDKYRYCEARRKALMIHVKEGYDNETWQVQSDLN